MRARPSAEPIASPSGLTWLVSRKRLPWRIRLSRSSGAFVVADMEALQKIGDVLAVLGAAVELELELGSNTKMAHAPGDLGAEETLGVAERVDRGQALRLLTERRDPDRGVAEVGADLDRDHGRELDPRVLDLAQQEVGELGAQEVADPVGAPAHDAGSRTWGLQSVR